MHANLMDCFHTMVNYRSLSEKIPIVTASHSAYQWLYRAIVAGRIRPGERILERELAEGMGISRTPIREAIRKLEQDGLVEVTPHRGVAVRQLSATEAFEVYQIRAQLEGLAARLAAKRRDLIDIERLEKIHADAEEAWRRGEQAAVIEQNNLLHDAIAHISGSQLLARTIMNLRASVNLLRIMSWSVSPDRPPRTLYEHFRIIQAIKAGDPVRADRCIRGHVWKTWRLVRGYLRRTREATTAVPSKDS
jgi:DNA-binding GntR family transcriptional regulator